MRCTPASRTTQISFSWSSSFSYSGYAASPGTGSTLVWVHRDSIRPGPLVCGFGKYCCSLLLLLCRHLRWTKLIVQLVYGSSELEGNVIGEVHRCTGIDPDVEGLVNGHEQRNGVRDRL